MMGRKGRLGRNILLDTLGGQTTEEPVESPSEGIHSIPTHRVDRSPWQPRLVFEPDALTELAESIKTHGLMQPLVVRDRNGRFELIAGERRWRAAQQAGLTQVPAIVQDVDDQTAATLALVENLQRKDLNPLEQGQALVRLRDEFNLDQQSLAELVSLSRSQVANLMRLDQLDERVKEHLAAGDLEMGHARALLGVPPEAQRPLAAKVIAQALNVRQTETLVAGWGQPKPTPEAKDPDWINLEARLGERFGTGVSISHNKKGKGKIVINYNDLDQLDGLLKRLESSE